MNATETPLIFTKLGNLPIADLDYATTWEDTSEYTKFVETYTLKGEIVKQSVHVLTKKGLPLGITAGALA